jgi:hypothetical protein
MSVKKGTSLRFNFLTVLVWLLVAGAVSFLLWQLINRISPSNVPLSSPTPNLTQSYQTLAAVLTSQPSSLMTTEPAPATPSPTRTLTPTESAPLPPIHTTTTQGTLAYTATPRILCNRAAAGNPIDITIPDDSQISPGQSFIKTWKLVNDGTCTWTTSYSAYFFYGDRMSAPQSVPLQENVPPAHSVEISVEMVAPTVPGTYQGNWKLADPDGTLFGIGPNSDSPFWVRIIVTKSETATPTPTFGPTPTSTPTGQSTPTATPEGQVSGELSPTPGDKISLDTLTLNSGEADLDYRVDVDQYHWLAPNGQATIGVYGSLQPGQADCQATNMSPAPIAVESLSPGTYLCYLTNQGRFGRMLFVTLNHTNFTLTLDLLTWPGAP